MNRSKHPLSPDSQSSKLLAHLVSGHTITPLQALSRFGVMALSQRIGFLKSRGHDIRSELVTVGKKRIARYSMCPGWRYSSKS